MKSKTLTDKHGDVITISDGALTLATRGHVVVHVKESTPGRVHVAAAYADPADLRAALDEVAPVLEQAGSYTRTDDDGLTLLMVQQQRDQATARAEKAVRELHRPVDVEPSDTICAACSTLRGSGESLRYFPTEEWPCATIQALDSARAARRDEEKR